MKLSYYAAFQYDPDGIEISFPDISVALTCADNEDEGLVYAEEALSLALDGMFLERVPQKTSFNQIILKDNQKAFLITTELKVRNNILYSPSVKKRKTD